MLAVLIGVGLAALAVWGPLRWFDAEVLNLAATVTEFGSTAITIGLGRIDTLDSRPDVVAILSAVGAVALPGVTAVALSRLASQVAFARSVVAAVLMLAALASFWFVTPTQALVLTGLALFAGTVVAVPLSLLIRSVVWAVIGLIGFHHVPSVLSGEDATVASSTATVIELTGIQSADRLWTLVLMVFAVAPFLFVASAALSSGD